MREHYGREDLKVMESLAKYPPTEDKVGWGWLLAYMQKYVWQEMRWYMIW